MERTVEGGEYREDFDGGWRAHVRIIDPSSARRLACSQAFLANSPSTTGGGTFELRDVLLSHVFTTRLVEESRE